MEVLRVRNEPVVKVQVECHSCNSLLEYTRFDIEYRNHGGFVGAYIKCPICKIGITVKQ